MFWKKHKKNWWVRIMWDDFEYERYIEDKIIAKCEAQEGADERSK